MKRVVIDTNVLVSSAISEHGNPKAIMDLISDEQIQPCYCTEIISEYSRVLAYPKFRLSTQVQAIIIHEIIALGIPVTPSTSTIPLTHEDDRMFYDTAKSSGAILITGNKKHYPDEAMIMTPSEFLVDMDVLARDWLLTEEDERSPLQNVTSGGVSIGCLIFCKALQLRVDPKLQCLSPCCYFLQLLFLLDICSVSF